MLNKETIIISTIHLNYYPTYIVIHKSWSTKLLSLNKEA